MQRAIELSLENVETGKGGPFAAIIVQGGRIIAEGVNVVTATNDPTAHAEIIAIREACRVLNRFHLDGCTIYATCEPCPMCLGAIYWAKLDRVFYANTREDAAKVGFSDRFIYEEVPKAVGERRIPMIRLEGNEALSALQRWREREDRIEY